MIIRERDQTPTKIIRRGQRYKVIREIGFGTFGKILEIETRDGRFALKTFTFANYNYHLTTIREIKAMRTISSPYVLEIEAIIEEGGKFNLLFEHFPNDLYKIIGTENFTIDEIRHIFWQILKGVEAIHEKEYLHRDLKTSNILVKRLSSTSPNIKNEMSQSSEAMGKVFNTQNSFETYDKREEAEKHEKQPQSVHQTSEISHYDGRRLPQIDDKSIIKSSEENPALKDNYECYNKCPRQKNMNYIVSEDRDYENHNQDASREIHCSKEANSGQASEAVKRECSEDMQNVKKSCIQQSSSLSCVKSHEEFSHNISNYRIRICDFGMSRTKSKEMTPGVVTLWYRSPELLLGLTAYSKSIDIWSLGCILLEFFKKKPLFKANTEVEELDAIIELCGTISEDTLPDCSNLPLYEKYNLNKGDRKILETFSSFSLQAADLADKMLNIDPSKRPSISECLDHPFFQKSA